MRQTIQIEMVKNGWVVSPGMWNEEPSSEEVHVFGDFQELVEYLAEVWTQDDLPRDKMPEVPL